MLPPGGVARRGEYLTMQPMDRSALLLSLTMDGAGRGRNVPDRPE
jgi:hypothetical protein